MFLGVAELMLVILALSLLFQSFSGVSSLENAKAKQQINMQAENNQSDLTQYAGATISGTEVAMLVKMAGYYNVCVTVVNGSNRINYFYTDTTLSQRQDNYDDILNSGCLTKKISGYESNYISPIDTYTCELTVNDDTDAVVGVVCTKN